MTTLDKMIHEREIDRSSLTEDLLHSNGNPAYNNLINTKMIELDEAIERLKLLRRGPLD